MSQSVAQELADKRTRLLQKLDTNESVASVLVALLGKLIITYKNTPSIKMGPIRTNSEKNYGEFVSQIEIVRNPLILPPRIIGHNDLKDYMAAKNIALAKVLSTNKTISDFFQELIERIDVYAEWKRIPFSKLKVIEQGAFISANHLLVIRVGKESILDRTPFNKNR